MALPKTVLQLGLGTVLSIYLVYVLASNVPALLQLVQDVKAQVAEVITQHGKLAEEHQQIKGLFNPLLEESRKQTRLQEKMCIQGARTKADAQDCLAP